MARPRCSPLRNISIDERLHQRFSRGLYLQQRPYLRLVQTTRAPDIVAQKQ